MLYGPIAYFRSRRALHNAQPPESPLATDYAKQQSGHS
jgi:hypothetical protein